MIDFIILPAVTHAKYSLLLQKNINTLNFRTQYAGKRVFVSLSPGPAYKLPHLDFSPSPFHFQHGLTHTESFILVYGPDKKLSNNWSSFSRFSAAEIQMRLRSGNWEIFHWDVFPREFDTGLNERSSKHICMTQHLWLWQSWISTSQWSVANKISILNNCNKPRLGSLLHFNRKKRLKIDSWLLNFVSPGTEHRTLYSRPLKIQRSIPPLPLAFPSRVKKFLSSNEYRVQFPCFLFCTPQRRRKRKRKSAQHALSPSHRVFLSPSNSFRKKKYRRE